jgi:uncharacterized protein (DUF885 family)
MKGFYNFIYKVFLFWMFTMFLNIENFVGAKSLNTGLLFNKDPKADLYWEALVQVANGNKEYALKLADAIKSNSPIKVKFSWKDNYLDNIDSFFDKLFITFVSNNPQRLSVHGLFDSIGIREHNKYLNDVSPEAFLSDFERKKECLNILKTYNLKDLSDGQKISYKIYSWMLNHIVSGEKFLFHDYNVNQMFGTIFDLVDTFVRVHRLEVAQDFENYISRIEKVSEQISQTIRYLKYQKNIGVVFPGFAIEKVINSIKKLLVEHISESVFYTHFYGCLDKVKIGNKDYYLERAIEAIKTGVYPALRELLEYLNKLLNSSNNYGVWALPDGDEYYSYILKFHTTTDLSADDIHELGLREVRKIQDEMRKIFAQEGIVDANKTVGKLMRELSKDKRFYYSEDEAGRKECLAQFENILARCRKKLSPLFDLKPKLPVEIKQVPKHLQEGQTFAYYNNPSIDGSRAGAFFVNLRNMNEAPKFEMETLTVHESEPGHHFQISIQQELNIPILRKSCGYYMYLESFNAFVEGWALYVEKLAYEQGFYSTSFDKLGHLGDELLRAVRLVVDTGIHKKKWTREQAIDYMQSVIGANIDSVATEVERYFVMPGQACSYKIGQLKILELRQRAKDKLGKNFDIRDFHNVVLTLGAAPLTVLEEVVDKYIQDKLSSKRV